LFWFCRWFLSFLLSLCMLLLRLRGGFPARWRVQRLEVAWIGAMVRWWWIGGNFEFAQAEVFYASICWQRFLIEVVVGLGCLRERKLKMGTWSMRLGRIREVYEKFGMYVYIFCVFVWVVGRDVEGGWENVLIISVEWDVLPLSYLSIGCTLASKPQSTGRISIWGDFSELHSPELLSQPVLVVT